MSVTSKEDQELVDTIVSSTALELLAIIEANPEYLVDSYYRVFGEPIRRRIRELLEAGLCQ